jgi:hypothetical protein
MYQEGVKRRMYDVGLILVLGMAFLCIFLIFRYYGKLSEASRSYNEARGTVRSLLSGIKQRMNEQTVEIRSIRDEVAFFQARNDFWKSEKRVDSEKLDNLSTGVETALVATQRFGSAVIAIKQDCSRISETQEILAKKVEDLSMKQRIFEEQGIEKIEGPAVGPLSIEKKEVRKGLDKLNGTELQVLSMLLEKSMAAPEIGKSLLKTREHTARLMKKLYEEGYIERETNRIPYTYKINESLRNYLGEVKSKAV